MASTKKVSSWDEKMIKMFHSYPIKNFIVNLTVFLVYLISIIYANTAYNSTDAGGVMLLGMCIACLISIIAHKFLSIQTQKVIAKRMMEEYKTAADTSTNPYFYYFRRECEICGGVQKRKGVVILKIITIILKVINLLFSVLTALVLLAVSLIPAIVFGGFSCLAYIISRSSGSNGLADAMLRLAKLSIMPAKYILAFLPVILVHQFVDSSINYNGLHMDEFKERPASADHVTILGTKPSEMGKTQSELQIDSYLSIPQPSSVFPNTMFAQWETYPQLTARGADATLVGTILADASHYKTNAEREQLLRTCEDNLTREFESQIQAFLKDYPNATQAKVECRLTVKAK